jgi:hypothetical protein
MEPFNVFLSHNSKDEDGVRKLFAVLQERGLRPWLDYECLMPGIAWQDALERVIKGIPVAAVLVGRDGYGPWQQVEIRALLEEFTSRKLPVIPVLLPEARRRPKLPLFLRAFNWVDLRGGFREEGINRLVWGITGQKPSTRSESPSLPLPAGEILAPRRGEQVGPEFTVEAKVSAIPPAYHLGIAVQVGNLLWPKDLDVPAQDRRLKSKICEGGLPGQRFSVALLMVDAAGHRQISKWFEDGQKTGNFPGFTTALGRKWLLDAVGELVLGSA